MGLENQWLRTSKCLGNAREAKNISTILMGQRSSSQSLDEGKTPVVAGRVRPEGMGLSRSRRNGMQSRKYKANFCSHEPNLNTDSRDGFYLQL